jgi:predicted secreted protein
MTATYAAIATRTFYSDTEIAAGTVRTIPIFCQVARHALKTLAVEMPCYGVFSDVLRGVSASAASHRVNL